MRIRARRIAVPVVCRELYGQVLAAALEGEAWPAARPLPREAVSLLARVKRSTTDARAPTRGVASDTFISQEVIEHLSGFLSAIKASTHKSRALKSSASGRGSAGIAPCLLHLLQGRVSPVATGRPISKSHLHAPNQQGRASSMTTALVNGVQLSAATPSHEVRHEPLAELSEMPIRCKQLHNVRERLRQVPLPSSKTAWQRD